jgi:cytoskeletal protein CcmA (bactofilin family)
MFTRTSRPKMVSAGVVKAAEPKSGPPQPIEADAGVRSVIGGDLTILGQGLKIIGRGVLQIDGNLSSDVQAMEVIVGRKGKVTGMVAGQQVSIEGQVAGTNCARSVTLQASSSVECDVHHLSLSVEQGARFEGRSRRASSEGDLNAVMESGGSR